MTAAVRVLGAREDLCALVTALLPVISAESEDPSELRSRYADVLSGLSLSADSDRDMALLTGAMEVARWVAFASDIAGVNSKQLWQNYMTRTSET